MINEGLYNNYLEKRDELKAKKREMCSDLVEMDLALVALRGQLDKGVETKDEGEKQDGRR